MLTYAQTAASTSDPTIVNFDTIDDEAKLESLMNTCDKIDSYLSKLGIHSDSYNFAFMDSSPGYKIVFRFSGDGQYRTFKRERRRFWRFASGAIPMRHGMTVSSASKAYDGTLTSLESPTDWTIELYPAKDGSFPSESFWEGVHRQARSASNFVSARTADCD